MMLEVAHKLGMEKGRNSAADLWCIQCTVNYMTLDTPKIRFFHVTAVNLATPKNANPCWGIRAPPSLRLPSFFGSGGGDSCFLSYQTPASQFLSHRNCSTRCPRADLY